MKIALLTPTFSQFSGIDRVVELQAEELIKKGNQVTIFTLKAGINPKKANLVVMSMPKNPFFERLYRLFFFLDFFKIKKYSRLLKNYDLIISHQYPMNLLGCSAKKKYNIKYVYHNHGVAYPWLFKRLTERLYMRIFKFLTNLTAKKADEVVSISQYLKQELKKETSINSRIVYDKIDKKRFHKGIKGQKIKKKYGLGKNPVCLYVGRISPHKGIHLLIKAFNLVLKKMPTAKLLIVGKKTFDDYATELKKLAKKVNPQAIIFAEFVPDKDLPYYYAACDVYTTATLWEGFNMTVVEAQALGKPVVAFNLCAHPEVVKKGKLVKPLDICGFADAIISTIGD
ncbi:MAG: glycosyltransferase family 4 protein [Candidatus Margulisbacteria bacterium]|nr:glycosyltransferase family 4 protein [Candidatus Margulisiibacteriota bacterium]